MNQTYQISKLIDPITLETENVLLTSFIAPIRHNFCCITSLILEKSSIAFIMVVKRWHGVY